MIDGIGISVYYRKQSKTLKQERLPLGELVSPRAAFYDHLLTTCNDVVSSHAGPGGAAEHAS